MESYKLTGITQKRMFSKKNYFNFFLSEKKNILWETTKEERTWRIEQIKSFEEYLKQHLYLIRREC